MFVRISLQKYVFAEKTKRKFLMFNYLPLLVVLRYSDYMIHFVVMDGHRSSGDSGCTPFQQIKAPEIAPIRHLLILIIFDHIQSL